MLAGAMRTAICGGGPAGLYLAILLRRQDPGHEVVVVERNGPDDTFGFGVVFSDRTLSYLRDADAESHDEIQRTFETWDNVDVVHRGRKVSIRGNRFSGIARLSLLKILQRRAGALGVDVRYRTEVRDLEGPPFRDADLVVGADGVNSLVRRTFEDDFEPSLERRRSPYIWYGTPRLFHGLTLTFREAEAGLFIAHSYKFDRRLSTFIVECDEETFGRAGFAGAPEPEVRRALEAAFADDLEGAPLVSNASRWISFIVVKNRRWHRENVVLVGDALHTVHFSIGSGTKLALEDAIALARALGEAGLGARPARADVAAALARFEAARRPVVLDYQEVAGESMRWFETARRFLPLDPVRFAYEVMTRTPRVDRENLRQRDPEFVTLYERTLAGTEPDARA